MYRTLFAATLAVVIQATQLTTQVEDVMMDQLNFAREGELAQVADKSMSGADKSGLAQVAFKESVGEDKSGLAQVAANL